MSFGERLLLVGLAALVVLGVGRWVSPDLVNELARDLWALPEDAWTIGEERERSRELDIYREAILHRTRAKDQTAAAWIRGDLPLAEAVRRFREIDSARPEFRIEIFRRGWPGSSDEERYCRHLLVWARVLMRERPDEARELLPRLEAEVEELVGRLSASGPE